MVRRAWVVRQPDVLSGMLSIMDPNVTALERAFALAKSGEYAAVRDIKKRLVLEGYSATAITGPTLLKQLLALIQAAQGRDRSRLRDPKASPDARIRAKKKNR